MLRITNLQVPLDYDENKLIEISASVLSINKKDIKSINLHKRSIDARKKNNIHFVCSIDVILKNDKCINKTPKNVTFIKEKIKYKIPLAKHFDERPLIIGSGPAGLFCALILAQSGQNPIVIERGYDVDKRVNSIVEFWKNRKLDTNSNVQFGEGGAGTFSDGKLNTGINDFRIKKVLEEFVECGAPQDILYLSKPHIGTDNLRVVVKNIRKKIEIYGGEIRFSSKLVNIITENSKVSGALIEENGSQYQISTKHIILAIGHSARDTFDMLSNAGVALEQKPFSIGVRIEHLQEKINKSQYGKYYNNKRLGAADYKLAVHLKNNRGIYTFCMCPGGKVVASSSEKDSVVTNGMSEYSRSEINSNSALLVGISPKDFDSNHPLAGVKLQKKIEKLAFELGGKNYNAPVQRVEDFLIGRESTFIGEVIPSYEPGFSLSNLAYCLPDFVIESMKLGLIEMDKRLSGFAHPDAILTGVESRSSSPIRITRNDNFESISINGLYPCGEGAGYAGGIMSAAVDGIKVAESILINY